MLAVLEILNDLTFKSENRQNFLKEQKGNFVFFSRIFDKSFQNLKSPFRQRESLMYSVLF